MAASDKKLGALHEQVADALAEQVVGYDEPVLDAEGEVVATKRIRASPALLGAAIAFLKNNSITADPSTNAELAKLKTTLANRKRRGTLTPTEAKEATAQFDAMLGGMGIGILQ